MFADLYLHLKSMVGSPHEATFLELYVESIIVGAGNVFDSDDEPDRSEIRMRTVWTQPALIPQVWVNWIHHDPTSRERAQMREKKPFRVDFLFVDERVSDRPTVIEIDGLTHFGKWVTNEAGEKSFEPSLDVYTEHIKKDRWLRNQGWNVARITNQEVEELEEVMEKKDKTASFINFLIHRVLGSNVLGTPV